MNTDKEVKEGWATVLWSAEKYAATMKELQHMNELADKLLEDRKRWLETRKKEGRS